MGQTWARSTPQRPPPLPAGGRRPAAAGARGGRRSRGARSPWRRCAGSGTRACARVGSRVRRRSFCFEWLRCQVLRTDAVSGTREGRKDRYPPAVPVNAVGISGRNRVPRPLPQQRPEMFTEHEKLLYPSAPRSPCGGLLRGGPLRPRLWLGARLRCGHGERLRKALLREDPVLREDLAARASSRRSMTVQRRVFWYCLGSHTVQKNVLAALQGVPKKKGCFPQNPRVTTGNTSSL